MLIAIVAILAAIMSLWAMPASFRVIRDLITQVRADLISRVVREGQFVTIDEGFVFHYRERAPNGALRGIFIQDRRDPERINTYLAESGVTVESGRQNYLILEKGSVQRQTRGEVDPAMVSFERYAIDLSQFGSEGEGAPLKPRERSTMALLRLDPADPYVIANRGRLIAELNDRIINPLYVIVFGLLGFAALGQPRTTRQGRGVAIVMAIVVVVGLRIAGFGASALVAKSTWALVLAYGAPLVGLIGALLVIFGPITVRWPQVRPKLAVPR
jgi:lipopolysaccharide export system permease protein